MSTDLKQVTKQVFVEHLATFLDNLDICQQVQERLEIQFTPLQKQLVNQYYYHLFSQSIQNLIENSDEKEIEQCLQNLSINSQKRPFSDVEPELENNNKRISCYYSKSNPNKLRHLEVLEHRELGSRCQLVICKDLQTSQIKSFYKNALQIVEGTLDANPVTNKKIKFKYEHSNPEQVRELIVTKINAKYIFGKESENGKIKCFKKNGIHYI